METGMGSNSKLNDDERKALALGHHRPQYEKALAEKKASDASFKNCCKRIKSEGTSIEEIKLLIQLDTPEGEEALRAELTQKLDVARWLGSDIGTQFSFLDEPDRTPLDERAFARGKLDGMKGITARTPEGYSGEAEQAYLRGWSEGQAALMSALDLTAAGMADIAAAAEAQEHDDAEPAAPKKRGRPKGSKNAKANGKDAPTYEPADEHADAKARDAEAFTDPFPEGPAA